MLTDHLRSLDRALDKCLWRRGLRNALPRRVLRVLTGISLAALLLGLLCWPLTRQVFCFGLGCALATLNLYGLSRTVGGLVARQAGAGQRLLGVLFNLSRLTLTALVLFFVLRLEPLVAVGLLAGFTAGVAVLGVLGFAARHALE